MVIISLHVTFLLLPLFTVQSFTLWYDVLTLNYFHVGGANGVGVY
jgi:hypothetical protein